MSRRVAAFLAALLALACLAACGSASKHPVKTVVLPPSVKHACPEALHGQGAMGECAPPAAVSTRAKASSVSAHRGIEYPDLSNNDPCVCAIALKAHGLVGEIDKVNQGVGFIDRTFAAMAADAKAHGLAIGGYDFDQEYTADEVYTFVKQLHAAGIYRNTPRTFPPTLDVEFGTPSWSGLEHQLAVLYREYGRAQIYTGAWYWLPHFGCRVPPRVTFWLSGYPVASLLCGLPGNRWVSHQYTDHGYIGAGHYADVSRWLGSSTAFNAFILAAKPPLTPAQRKAQKLRSLRAHEALVRELHNDIDRHHCRKGKPWFGHAKPRSYHKVCGRWLREGRSATAVVMRYRRELHLGKATAKASSFQSVSFNSTASTSFGGYSAFNPLPAGQAFGSPTSPFRTPIGTPVVLSNSASLVSYVLKLGSPMPANATSGPRWKHPTVFPTSTDPVVELRATEPWGTNALTGRKIHVPAAWAAAPPKPSEGGDAHLEVVLLPSDAKVPGETAELWQANPPSGGVLKFSWGSPGNIEGNLNTGAATAANFELAAGQIRVPDLKSTTVPPHALCAVVKSNKAKSVVWPAVHTDGRSTEAAAPIEGQRFMLDYSDAEIDALSMKPWKKLVLKEIDREHYGFYDCDSGGPGLAFELEGSTMYTAFGAPNGFNTVGKEQGLSTYNGEYVFGFSGGVNWSRLKAIAPPAH